MCEYKFRNGERCKEEVLPNSKYCILHVDLSEDEESEEFERINKLKEEKVKEKVNKGDFNFEGAKLSEVDFSGMTIEGSVNFVDIVIRSYASFSEVVIRGNASFEGVKIGTVAEFDKVEIGEDTSFKGAEIGVSASFSEAVIKGNASFEGVKIGEDASFDKVEIGEDASFEVAEIGRWFFFDRAEIGRDVLFNGAEIGIDASFRRAKIGRDASFSGAKIGEYACFDRAKIGRDVKFDGAKIGRDASFDEAEIGRYALFDWKAEIGENVSFKGAKIGEIADFDKAEIGKNAWFDKAEIGENVLFYLTEIRGELSFKDAKFKKPYAQEKACRKAKRICEDLGNRREADYYFYREMEAKRKQKYKTFSLKPILKLIRKLGLEKPIRKHIGFLEKERGIYWGFLELPVQYIFGYGVYPWRVIATWLLTVFSLAFVYWIGNGVEAADSLVEYIYFSVVTAATPGYGGYHPKPGIYQGLARFEAIFGTFMWAAFIATFARKYMR